MKITLQLNNNKLLVILLFLATTITVQAQTFNRVEDVAGLGVLEENNGVATADYDGDGDLDIFIVAKAKDNSERPKSLSRLFRNDNDGSFTDVTQAAGFSNLFPNDIYADAFLGLAGFKYGAYWGDYNNDGFPDLFMTFLDRVQLWRNQGDGTFINVTQTSGITEINGCGNTGATWFDYNHDGLLDLFIADWQRCGQNTLYLNQGNETFQDVSESVGISTTENYASFVGLPFDFDSNGFIDLYVTNDLRHPNELFISQNGNTFTEDAPSYNINTTGEDMAITIGDYNLDGHFDFFITAIDLNFLLTNNGDGTFTESAEAFGINNTLWSWGTKFSDFDLDGDEDLVIVNGYFINNRDEEPNFYFKNLFVEGQSTFQNISAELGLNELGTGVEVLDFDYDNDGDMDLLVTNNNKECFFYENKLLNFDDAETTLNWLKVHLEGTVS
uniref:FG-GAP repeat domain-containing protein n=1 Tax=Winogradskyella sp. TaxID=1883156 RepID=UPI00262A161A